MGSPREPGPNPCACSPESVRARGFARRTPTCTHRGPWGNVPCAFMCVRECRRPAGRRWLRKARGTGPFALVIEFYGTLYCMQSGLGKHGVSGVRSLAHANAASMYRKTPPLRGDGMPVTSRRGRRRGAWQWAGGSPDVMGRMENRVRAVPFMVPENNPGLFFSKCMSHLPFSSLSSTGLSAGLGQAQSFEAHEGAYAASLP